MAQQEIRTQRENELAVLKKTLEDEMVAHEDAIAAMRSKHSKAVDELNEQLESAKKVRLEIQPFMYTTEKLCYNNGRMLSCLFLGRIAHVRFLHNLCTHFLHMTTGSLVLHSALSTSLFSPPLSLSLSLPFLIFHPLPLPLPLPHSLSQSKQNMEKGKGKLEGENESLQLDLRDLRAAFAEGDKRRKTAEAQLSESQAKNTDDAAKIQDITSQNDKLKVWRNGIMAEWDMGLVRC